jgi:hypothetical protein
MLLQMSASLSVFPERVGSSDGLRRSKGASFRARTNKPRWDQLIGVNGTWQAFHSCPYHFDDSQE